MEIVSTSKQSLIYFYAFLFVSNIIILYCKLCGMRRRWYRDLKQHYEAKHPFNKMHALKENEAPTNGFWWCTKEPRIVNEKWLNLGTNVLRGQEN